MSFGLNSAMRRASFTALLILFINTVTPQSFSTSTAPAGLVLLGLSVVTLRAARRPRELPFAAIPLLFAIQQLVEGVIRLTFDHEAPVLNAVMTHVSSFFSRVLWTAYLLVAVLLIEPPGWRRTSMAAVAAAGLAVGAYLMYTLAAFTVVARPTGQHIEYVSPHFFVAAAMSLYLLSTCVGPILSTDRLVRVFGVLALLSFGAVYYFYATWFISVWCFFAALLSVIILARWRIRVGALTGRHRECRSVARARRAGSGPACGAA
jgi:hypothetical protein